MPREPFVTEVKAAAAVAPPKLGPIARRRVLSVDELEAGVIAADRAVLGRAISVIESSHPGHVALGRALLKRLMPRTGTALRLGLTGTPGAGKSTLIERLGSDIVADGRRVAVLAVDPSSGVSGGSILGDKTRMPKLAANANAFIRPSPSAGTLGGVARRTRETMLLCEAAGFDIVIIETVGVGQSETVVSGMTDVFLAVLTAGGGDELQGIKRGLLEVIDLVAINKADGDNVIAAQRTAAELDAVLSIVARPDASQRPAARPISAHTGEGLTEIWALIEDRHADLIRTGRLDRRRREQAVQWVRSIVRDEVLARAEQRSGPVRLDAETAVLEGKIDPAEAAERILNALEPTQGTTP
ncbi:MAG: methylmalonyl Co-A mutase-associated GTPase MeaB [Planctomycetota bacterium]